MPSLVVVVDKHNGAVSILHDDRLMQRIGTAPVAVERLSEIEFDGTMWNTCSKVTGAVMFSHPRRDACLDWEHRNVAALLAERRKCSSTPTTK